MSFSVAHLDLDEVVNCAKVFRAAFSRSTGSLAMAGHADMLTKMVVFATACNIKNREMRTSVPEM